jgi:hypothetical protein
MHTKKGNCPWHPRQIPVITDCQKILSSFDNDGQLIPEKIPELGEIEPAGVKPGLV